ncbi:MAG: 23S rRNA (guanosine(2251)-2'-O)-methyltransferase RlmB [Clostridiales bacterium]|jgi:23S rRNA (guanosine2251-2'-O)-methyltransferase|nr:23S rRNA (guanosine(2251)-2'-O)-methyltransferase RlmB [Clostridiales bacterium]
MDNHNGRGAPRQAGAAGGGGGGGEGWKNDFVTGRNPVLEAIKAGRPINKILVQRGEREGSLKMIEALARERGLVLQSVDKAKLDGMSGNAVHQGVIALAAVKEYAEPDDILARAEERGEPVLMVIADGVEDPHNLGAIIRTAEAVGAHGLIIPKRRAVGLTPIVAKASSGAIEYMLIARATNIASEIKTLKRRNVWVVGADADSRTAYTDFDYTGNLALVIGGEGGGLGRLVRDSCDATVRLPMRGRISSLNASVAASVLLYEALRQRGLAAMNGAAAGTTAGATARATAGSAAGATAGTVARATAGPAAGTSGNV